MASTSLFVSLFWAAAVWQLNPLAIPARSQLISQTEAGSGGRPRHTFSSSESQTPDEGPNRIDAYCGPRCAHEILRRYGIDSVDLQQCIHELRWSSERNGVDMQAIAEFLQKHDIHTAAFEAKPGYVLRWEHPAVVHCPSTAADAGHFVVLFPNATRDRVHIWDGPALERMMSAQAFSEWAEGGVLLTSPDPISESIMPFCLTVEELQWRSGLSVLAALVGGAFAATLRLQRLRTISTTVGSSVVEESGLRRH